MKITLVFLIIVFGSYQCVQTTQLCDFQSVFQNFSSTCGLSGSKPFCEFIYSNNQLFCTANANGEGKSCDSAIDPQKPNFECYCSKNDFNCLISLQHFIESVDSRKPIVCFDKSKSRTVHCQADQLCSQWGCAPKGKCPQKLSEFCLSSTSPCCCDSNLCNKESTPLFSSKNISEVCRLSKSSDYCYFSFQKSGHSLSLAYMEPAHDGVSKDFIESVSCESFLPGGHILGSSGDIHCYCSGQSEQCIEYVLSVIRNPSSSYLFCETAHLNQMLCNPELHVCNATGCVSKRDPACLHIAERCSRMDLRLGTCCCSTSGCNSPLYHCEGCSSSSISPLDGGKSSVHYFIPNLDLWIIFGIAFSTFCVFSVLTLCLLRGYITCEGRPKSVISTASSLSSGETLANTNVVRISPIPRKSRHKTPPTSILKPEAELIDKLSEGRYSEIWRAHLPTRSTSSDSACEEDDGVFVLKLAKKTRGQTLSASSIELEHVQNELSIFTILSSRAVQCSNIIQFIDGFCDPQASTQKIPAIGMEWARRGSLNDILVQQTFALPEALDICRQLCNAISFLHDNFTCVPYPVRATKRQPSGDSGIPAFGSYHHKHVINTRCSSSVMTHLSSNSTASSNFLNTAPVKVAPPPRIAHRDIKSHNVLVRLDNSVCLADFGLAVDVDSCDAKDLKKVGSPRYMAPELLTGVIANHTESLLHADVYAVSLVLWEILARTHFVDINANHIENFTSPAPARPPLAAETFNVDPSSQAFKDAVCSSGVRPVLPLWLRKSPKPDRSRSEFDWNLRYLGSSLEDAWAEDEDCRPSASQLLHRITDISLAIHRQIERMNEQLLFTPLNCATDTSVPPEISMV